MNKHNFSDVDSYIACYPADVQAILQQLRTIIKNTVPPETQEVISYQMPAYNYNGILVYFAAYKNHIGFYPTSSGVRVFQAELAGYKTSKGAIQFPIDQPLPIELITKIVQYRVRESSEKDELKMATSRRGK